MIRRMLERWGPLTHGVGDDAGMIKNPGGTDIVVSTDSSVENVHFREEWLTPREIGYRAAAAALSDLAAMGAKPMGILVALTIPERWRAHIDAVIDGIGDAARLTETPIIGGDTSRGEQLSLTFTVLGSARALLLRSAAREGDNIYVTGRLGGAGAALAELRAARDPSPENRKRFASPEPRIREAIWLAEQGATTAIDISDGLAADLGHIAAASRSAMCIDIAAVPTMDGVSPLEAANSGEEYELIVTAPSELKTERFNERFALELTRIGSVEHGPADVRFLENGVRIETPPGYSHFKSS